MCQILQDLREPAMRCGRTGADLSVSRTPLRDVLINSALSWSILLSDRRPAGIDCYLHSEWDGSERWPSNRMESISVVGLEFFGPFGTLVGVYRPRARAPPNM